MLAPPTKEKAPPSPPSSHPRRLPAHLSVSLRHGPNTKYKGGARPEAQRDQNPLHFSTASNDAGESILMAGESLDCSSECPNAGIQPTFNDGEPPYLLPQQSYPNLPITSGSASQPQNFDDRRFQPKPMASTDGSSDGDYRSVIDDLTIENKRLRERIRKYESRYNPDLEEDKMFELKIHHGIPSNKMRELENTLQQFLSGSDAPERQNSRHVVNTSTPRQQSYTPTHMKQRSSSSSSNSRPQDSAYASMSRSGQTSISTLHRNGSETRKYNGRLKHGQKIKKFLNDIPEGLLPKHASMMTERLKKKMVVKRLEQIFTGKVDGIFGDHSQPLQQQEVSNAATLEQVANNFKCFVPPEGLREAHISANMGSVFSRAAVRQMSANKNGPTNSGIDKSPKAPRTHLSPTQRPTRPLDLDPNRAQVPMDNVEYIRHLGLSTPQLVQANSGDADPGAQGWIPLNLLIGMAQLHIINVTPDFVRSAVADVSEKFQLSIDGRLIRWRGGSEGTSLSSDGEGSEGGSHSTHDSDTRSHEESDWKRPKMDGYTARVRSNFRVQVSSAAASPRYHPFHYKPLFHHQNSDEESTSIDDTKSSVPYAPISGTGRSWQTHFRAQEPRTGFPSERRRDNGPIVFYRGANFYTDLSGDRGDISTTDHISTGVGTDRCNMAQEVLGDTNSVRPHQSRRIPSGSLRPFRSFKDYSCGPQYLHTEVTRHKTPELLSGTPDIDFISGNLNTKSQPEQCLEDFDACGLGGTRPADHFAIRVATRMVKINGDTHTRISKFSAPRLNARKYRHSIPKETLNTFLNTEQGLAASKLVSLNANPSPTPTPSPQAPEPSFRRECFSSHFQNLQPSRLPRPSAYFSDDSSSQEDSDSEDSYTGISHLRHERPMYLPFAFANSNSGKRPRVPMIKEPISMDIDKAEEEEEKEEEEKDRGICGESDDGMDMLAYACQADSKMVAAQEKDFEMEVDDY